MMSPGEEITAKVENTTQDTEVMVSKCYNTMMERISIYDGAVFNKVHLST